MYYKRAKSTGKNKEVRENYQKEEKYHEKTNEK